MGYHGGTELLKSRTDLASRKGKEGKRRHKVSVRQGMGEGKNNSAPQSSDRVGGICRGGEEGVLKDWNKRVNTSGDPAFRGSRGRISWQGEGKKILHKLGARKRMRSDLGVS